MSNKLRKLAGVGCDQALVEHVKAASVAFHQEWSAAMHEQARDGSRERYRLALARAREIHETSQTVIDQVFGARKRKKKARDD